MSPPRLLRLVAALAGCAVVACGAPEPSAPQAPAAVTPAEPAPPPPPPPPPLTEDPLRLGAGVTSMWEAMAERLTDAGADCGAAIAAITSVRAEFAEVRAAQAEVAQGDRRAQLDRALDASADRLAASVARLLEAPALTACAHLSSFTSAFDTWSAP
ncbi:MAG: hypothetical protein R3B48_18235 [Kofleriaceae bacterium]